MSRRSGRRTYWCMDCNMYAVPGPYQQCADCRGEDGVWDEHRHLLSDPLWDPRPLTPVKPVATKPVRPVYPIPAVADEVTYHPRVSVAP